MKVSKQEAERKRKEYEQRKRRETGNTNYTCSMSDWLLLNNVSIFDSRDSYTSSSCSSSYDYSSSDSSSSSSCD